MRAALKILAAIGVTLAAVFALLVATRDLPLPAERYTYGDLARDEAQRCVERGGRGRPAEMSLDAYCRAIGEAAALAEHRRNTGR